MKSGKVYDILLGVFLGSVIFLIMGRKNSNSNNRREPPITMSLDTENRMSKSASAISLLADHQKQLETTTGRSAIDIATEASVVDAEGNTGSTTPTYAEMSRG